jgi:hypothetical protein
MHRHALLPLALGLFGCAVASEEPARRDATGAEPPTDPAPAIDAAPASTGLTCDDATCVDPSTGLTWQSPPDDTARTWADAVAYCEALTIAGGGWRLPRVQELRSLIRGCPNTALGGACRATDPGCTVRACMEGCDQCATTIVNDEPVCLWAPGLRGSCRQAHWSATEYTDSIDPGAWYVDFGHGAFVHGWLRSQPLRVRCVRFSSAS